MKYLLHILLLALLLAIIGMTYRFYILDDQVDRLGRSVWGDHWQERLKD